MTELTKYTQAEVAAVFHDVAALENAVEKLTAAGFGDGDFNIMGTDETIREKLADGFMAVEEVADDPRVPRRAFIPRPTRRLFEAGAIGVPAFLLGMAGLAGVIATGGAAALGLAVLGASGALGATLGAALAGVMEEHHAKTLAEAMEGGGIVLWVRASTPEAQETAIRVLKEAGGDHVHAHEIERTWGTEDIPLSEFNPDPFLEPDPNP